MFYYLKWCFFVLTLCPLSGQAQLTFEELTQLYHPDIQPIEFNEADSTYVAEVINNDPGFELDMYGLHPDSLKNADDSLRFSTGLGSIREMYNDEMMGVSFNFRKYPYSLPDRELILVYLNGRGPFVDHMYSNAAVFEKRNGRYRLIFSDHGTVRGYFEDSSFLIHFTPCCSETINIFYHLKQSLRHGLDTLEALTVYHSPIWPDVEYEPPRNSAQGSISIPKGTKIYTSPSRTTSEFTYSIGAVSRNTKAPVLDTVYYDDANWFAVRLSQDQISFDPESTSNRTPKNSSHIVWFSK